MNKSCILLTPKGDKFGNKSMQLTPARQQIQTDFCENRQKFKTTVCSYQSLRNSQSQVQAKIATKTPIKMQSKGFIKTPKLTTSIKKEDTGDLDLKPSPAMLVPKVVLNFVLEEAVKTVNESIDLLLQICAKIAETSTTENEPSTGEEQSAFVQQEDAPVTSTENEFAETNDDDIKITSAQLKWTEKILNLLNTGSKGDLSKTLATIGSKTAVRITRYRKIHGNFEQIADLQARMGWSDKVYQKFLTKNFL